MAGINEIPLWNSPQIFQIFPKYSFFVDNKNNNNNITIIIIIIKVAKSNNVIIITLKIAKSNICFAKRTK